MRNVYLSFVQGNSVRDLLRLGMLDHLLEVGPDLRIVLLSPAYAVREFREEFEQERVILRRHELCNHVSYLSGQLRKFRMRASNRRVVDLLFFLEAVSVDPPDYVKSVFKEFPSHLVVSTHPMSGWDWDIVSYAHKKGVPTAGVLKSWDNLHKGLRTLPRKLAVWNEVNRREAIEMAHYREEEVSVVGPAAFDRYFTSGVIRPREEFWRRLGLDPTRPVVVFATAGVYDVNRDETFMLDLLLHFIETHPSLSDVQLVCRLHPASRLEYFWSYRDRVKLSFGSYIKTLGWSMTRAEVDEVANMLCHADLVITPASTMTIEAAVFDTPVIVSAFSEIQPEHAHWQFDNRTFKRHFKPFVDNDWVPIARSCDELLQMMVRSLKDLSWYREGREQIIKTYVPFTDGRCGERVARFIADQAGIKGRRRDME